MLWQDGVNAESVRKNFIYDAGAGKLIWRVHVFPSRIGKAAGSLNSRGYLRLLANGKGYAVHRLVWLYVYGNWPKGEIDHINGMRADNRVENLRDVSHSDNMRNRKVNSLNRTGLRGVSHRSPNCYSARIYPRGKEICLGNYRTPEDAYAAYLKASEEHYGEFNGISRRGQGGALTIR